MTTLTNDHRYGIWMCATHRRWVEICRPEGDTLRPCPECRSGDHTRTIKATGPCTGLMA